MSKEELRIGVLPDEGTEVGFGNESKEDEGERDEGVVVFDEFEIEIDEPRKMCSSEGCLLEGEAVSWRERSFDGKGRMKEDIDTQAEA